MINEGKAVDGKMWRVTGKGRRRKGRNRQGEFRSILIQKLKEIWIFSVSPSYSKKHHLQITVSKRKKKKRNFNFSHRNFDEVVNNCPYVHLYLRNLT